MKKLIASILLSTSIFTLQAQQENLAPSLKTNFIANEGQYPSDIKYMAYPAYVQVKERSLWVKGTDFSFVGINDHLEIVAENKTQAVFNYLQGNDPKNWKQNIAGFSKVIYKNIYDGIDLVFYGLNKGIVQYHWIVSVGADPSQIKWQAAKESSIENKGNDLTITNKDGEFYFNNLKAFQPKQNVEVKFNVENNTISYALGNYDKTQPLTIDPDIATLSASTFLGHSAQSDYGQAITVDNSGNVYVAGQTWSTSFPTTSGAYDQSHNSSNFSDAYIANFDNSLTNLLACTFIGGNTNEYINAIALNSSGDVYVAGYVQSSTYPTTSGVYKTSHQGGTYDGFISKFNSALTSLSASTYIGSSGNDYITGLALDANGDIYVSGYTDSYSFPTTSGCYQNTSGGYQDGFVSKLPAALTSLSASTYIGGSGDEYVGGSPEKFGSSLVIDGNGKIVITGYTTSTNFPTTGSPAQGSHGGGSEDGFVTSFNSTLASLNGSTYLGGTDNDYLRTVTVDGSNNIFVAGDAYSGYPTVSGSFQTSHGGGYKDVVLSKLNSTLTSLSASTYVGYSSDEECFNIKADNGNNIYITGLTWSSFPTITNCYDVSFNGGNTDAFVAKFNNALSSQSAGTYLGGNKDDIGYGLALDPTSGSIFVTGGTYSSNSTNSFPTAGSPYDGSYNGQNDVFISKFSNVVKPRTDFTANKTTICSGASINFTDQSQFVPTSWNWTFQGGTPSTSTSPNPTITYTASGTYSVSLTATNSAGNDTKTKTSYITVSSSSYTPGVSTWTGAIDTDWTKAGNWDICGDGVPTTNTEVVIPTGLTNYPVINSNVTCKKITATGTGNYTVNPSYEITLTQD